MKQYQLVIFRFKYTDDLVCIWPVCFDFDPKNNFGQIERDILERAIKDLEGYPGIKDVQIIHNKIAVLTECVETFDSILKTQPDDDSVSIKYLKLERQIELVSHPRFDYETNSYYIPIQLRHIKFPIRVRAKNFKFLLDDLELPILLLREQK